ncbi:thrombospondin type 3 repeat-containing protein, partial [Flavobacteriaceae bacterium]|nr:thrombospondin type 3 repeat-containing protein [Flavobacteriaceae bacterium]
MKTSTFNKISLLLIRFSLKSILFFLVFNSFVLKASTVDPIINSHFNVTAFADEDGDGVEDEDDSCAGTPAGETVDASGCSESQKDDDGDGVFNNVDQCPSTESGVEVDENGCAISCNVAVSYTSGPLSQEVSNGSAVENVVFTYVTDCAESEFDFDVINLPSGVSWYRSGTDLVVTSDINGPVNSDPGPYEYIVFVRTNTEISSVTGLIQVVASSTTTTTQTGCSVDLYASSGPQSQAVDEGVTLEDVIYQFDTDCEDVTIAVTGLPNGVSWVGEGNNITVSGVADTQPGQYFYTVIVGNDTTQSFVEGLIFVNESSVTTTSTTTSSTTQTDCSINLYASSGPQSQAVDEGAILEDVIYQFDTDCDDLTLDVTGLPNGVSWVGEGNNITVSGVADTQPGQYFYTISVGNDTTQSFVEGLIFVNESSVTTTSTTSTTTQTGCSINLYTSSGPQSQFVETGSPIEDVVFQIDTDCEDLVTEVSGLPNGIVWSTEGDTLTISGQVDDQPGEYVYSISLANSFSQSFSQGLIYVTENSSTGTSTQSCYIDLYQTAGFQFQALGAGETIEDLVYQFDSNCEDDSIGESIIVSGLPNGLVWSSDGNVIIVTGQLDAEPGSYSFSISVNSSSTEAVVYGEIMIIDSVSIADSDQDGVPDFFDQCPNTENGALVDVFGCEVNDNETGDYTYTTENGCEIQISNIPSNGEVAELCSSEPFNEQIIVSSSCTSSIITAEVSGLPLDWVTTLSTDSDNNSVLTVVSGENRPVGTYDVLIRILDTSSNFVNETNFTLVLVSDCNDLGNEGSIDDADGDGVPDFFDACPETNEGVAVDAFGCSRDQSYNNNISDSDNDGISDIFDACPNTPDGVAINEFGCSEDQLNNQVVEDEDEDGIPNYLDVCPDTEPGVSVDAFGCGINQSPDQENFTDTDSDGVPDDFDVCPDTKEGASVDYFGCAQNQNPGESDFDDNDNDGVPNIADACPNSEEGATVDFFGCSVNETASQNELEDSDQDGIPDFFDACPETAKGEIVNSFGCAEDQTFEDGSISDADNDGIPDVFDACPETEEGLEVNSYGCSENQSPLQGTFSDSDSDGVPDEFDACPDTSIGVFVNEFGCPLSDSQVGKTFIPDDAFEQTLINLGLDDALDNYVNTEAIESVTSLDVSSSQRSDGSKIYDLTGLESFSNLVELIAVGNNLFYVDTYNNSSLEVLIVDNNLISNLYTNNNTNLRKLSVNNNLLHYIDLSENQNLSDLNIGNNSIYTIDFSNNTGLVNLKVNNTPLQSLDISTLSSLDKLEVINTEISCISVSETQISDIPSGWKINNSAFYSIECGYVSEFDSDNDGILNEFDLCPGTPFGQQVDGFGCALVDSDRDLDGVVDDFDACPDTPENSEVNEFGCSIIQLDSDLDGVLNVFDQCPESPIGIAVNNQGCSEKEEKKSQENGDDDQDGVINSLDRCPDTIAGTIVNEFGCTDTEINEQTSSDSDLDGVLNVDDLCPDTGIGLAVNEFGCPLNEIDSDFDKVTDDLDLCPNTESGVAVDQYGCSLSQKENDSDLDGVENSKDYCSNTAPYSEVNSNGCSVAQISIDSDFDGVRNSDDQCPNTKPFEVVNENGCSDAQQDDDRDGVANGLDRCRATPLGTKVDQYGCSVEEEDGDDDNDGVVNSVDKCPNTASGAPVDNKGCAFLPPVIYSQVFEKTENSRDEDVAEIREYLGKIIVEDPNSTDASNVSNISLQLIESEDSSIFEIQNDSLFIVGTTDYEEKPKHVFQIKATNNLNLSTLQDMTLIVLDIPNTNTISNFEVAVFDLSDESTSSKVDYKRYLNPKGTKGVGKWKIKKKITGGADAGLFTIRSPSIQKNGEGESDDYLDFIVPPDYENPQDHNRDNIYEVEVVNINTNDGESAKPISVTQTNLVMPEGN